ncbi:MAG: hypothetical protein WC790_01400 [Candidatus Paceibacterota bacterium]
MNHLKTTLYSLAVLILVGFVFGQAATTNAYSGQGPYTFIGTISFSPATTESTKVNLTFDWNTQWVPSNVSLYYGIDSTNVYGHKLDFFTFWTPLTIDLGALSAGTHTISFMLWGSNVNAGSGWTLWTVTYNPMSFSVTPPPPPPPPSSFSGMTFTASPTTVPYGGSTLLFWMAFGASSCTASGSWSGAKPSVGFESRTGLTSDQTYVIQCGAASASRTVTVTLPKCSLPWGGTIDHGQSVTAYSQSRVVTPALCTAASTMETRTCNMGVLSGSYTYQSCVEGPAVPTASLSSPSLVDEGQSARLSWSSSNATSCTAAGGFSTGGATSGSARTGILTQDTTFQITCTDGTTSASASRRVTVRHPQATISASPSRVAIGGTSVITWSSTDVTGGSRACTVSGPGLSRNTRSGSQTVTISSQSEYTISCTTQTTPISSSVVVNVGLEYKEF